MPDLTNLDDGNMRFTTDFRRVYATMAATWMGCQDTVPVLKGDFAPLPVIPGLSSRDDPPRTDRRRG